jgi:PEGA domain
VFVDGQPLGALTGGQGSFFVPSGKHELIVKAPGYADMVSEITVKPTSPTDVTVVPVVMGEKTPTNWKRIGGFAALGAGVGFGALGLVGSVKVYGIRGNQEYANYRQTYASTASVCDANTRPVGFKPEPDAGAAAALAQKEQVIKDFCEPASTAEIMQIVFYPLAAIAAGAGVFLVATSGTRAKEKPAVGLVVLPQVSRTGVKVDVGFQF